MDRLDMAIALLEEAKEEKARLAKYEKDYSNIPKYGAPGYWEAWDKMIKKYPRTPKKSVINDNIKMARRILVGEYM